jgi:hypothetical protein
MRILFDLFVVTLFAAARRSDDGRPKQGVVATRRFGACRYCGRPLFSQQAGLDLFFQASWSLKRRHDLRANAWRFVPRIMP